MIDSTKVALLVETSRGYGRGLLRGIMKYSRLHGPWQFHLTPGDFEQIVPRIKDWKGDGIIARVINKQTANLLLKTGLPLVVLDLPTEPTVGWMVGGVNDLFTRGGRLDWLKEYEPVGMIGYSVWVFEVKERDVLP